MDEGPRWTCEACGCNTNASSDANCGICGTSQSGPSILRRAGYNAARAAWLARPRGGNNRIDDFEDEHDLWESVVHGISDELILDGGDRGPRFAESTRQRFLDAARAFANRNNAEAPDNVDPDDLWEAATINSYTPYWMSSSPNEIQVGEGPRRRHLAHVPSGSGEGQAIRAENPFPRNSTVGFRVAFEHPTPIATGANMGGCYLVGVTTSSFSAWNENKGLQSSQFFFGIEDGGLVYEGSSRSRREADSSSLNSHGVLFGSRDVVTCITDGRTLTFWRDDTLLGTLINTLPRSVALYPVVVPFNSEVTVAITNVDSDPRPILQTFAVDWKEIQQEKEDQIRSRLAAQRDVLVQKDGTPTAKLRKILKSVYGMYGPHHDRLWYRCGWKLEKLEETLQGKNGLTFEDFCGVIEKVLAEEKEKRFAGEDSQECQVGDKVELVDGYEKFGDAKDGPLQVGDRGIVVDIQRGQNGEQRSIRVLHNSRRWYYQPQAIRSERSGLIECTSVWFLRGILRSHGFDHTSLESLVGKPVTETSWRVGDVVVPKSANGLMGRIVAASKDSDTVKVQWASAAFAEAVAIPAGDPLEIWRVKNSRLTHSTVMDAVVRDCVMEGGDDDVDDDSKPASANDKTRSDVASLSRLERIDIDSLVKESRRSSDSLASLFAGGLPDAFLSALSVAERLMNSLEPPDDLAERISSVGDLAIAIAEQLFGDPICASKLVEGEPSLESAEESNDLARTRQRARLAYRNRRLRLIRDSGRRSEEELQDRRSMILSLVSRGSRRGGPFLNEDRPIPHLLGAPGDLFGEAWDMGSALSGGPASVSRAARAAEGDSAAANTRSKTTASYLDSILRCRGDALQTGVKQGGTADHHAFVRQIVQNGIIADNVEWTKALVEAQSEKTQRRIPAILKSVVDEEGTPLLLLAINQRCSAELIGRLLDWGAPSRPEEVRSAASSDQPDSLSLLLQRTPLADTGLNVDLFSQPVRDVFEQSKVRQLELEKAMTEAAGKFMVDILHKLFELALCSRRLCSSKMEGCGRIICEILVGNVLLSAVQSPQKEPGEQKSESESPADMALGGLLGVLPSAILIDSLLSDKAEVMSYLLVCEEYLCCKDMTDVASGLTILLVFLRSFPQLNQSPVLLRFGIKKLVEDHHALASDRITKILSKRSESSKPHSQNSVLCPKNHVAVLHITRHSSFRCDLCGNGVDRGCPMHGCRQCDWDACEKCTDQSGNGLVKCTALKEIASICLDHLSSDGASPHVDNVSLYSTTLSELCANPSASELLSITEGLKRRNVSALSDLAALLIEPGNVTIHEFVSVVLPALHSSFVRQPEELLNSSRHTKKAKVSDLTEVLGDNRGDLIGFCQESLLELIVEQDIDTAPPSEERDGSDSTMQSENGSSEKKSTASIESDTSDSPEEKGKNKVDISYCAGAAEILRRLHQVLSFHEGVLETLGTVQKCSDLQALKRPIELRISPSTFSSTNFVSSKTSSVLHAEPLVSVRDIYGHILRTFRITDEQYLTFCRGLSSERALIVERPGSSCGTWRVAKVLSFDERCGANTVQYATSWNGGLNDATVGLNSDSISSFLFSGPTSDLILAARQYYVIYRGQADTAGIGGKSFDTTHVCGSDQNLPPSHGIGNRVESNCENDDEWSMYTVLAVETSSSTPETPIKFVLVSDEGCVRNGVPAERIRTHSPSSTTSEDGSRPRRTGRSVREERNGLFPFFASRQRTEAASEPSMGSPVHARALKRSWSALGLANEMHPVDLQVTDEDVSQVTEEKISAIVLSCSVGGSKLKLIADVSQLEGQPDICVSFSSHEKLPGLDMSSKKDATLIWALREVFQKQDNWTAWPPKTPCALYFSLQMNPQQSLLDFPPDLGKVPATNDMILGGVWPERNDNRSRKLSSRSLSSEDSETSISEGFDATCVKCMEVLAVLSECAENPSSSTVRDGPKLPGFANLSLSKKLADQLDDPVSVVGGALPEWCLSGPAFAPCVFSYDTRRTLLERAAFGVSRSTLRQQEAKVNVQRLRQRMASLRSKAVELVGEAFSGGAEDPTALQLQADELYGMEEALAMKVRAAFRAQNWLEHSLQVAKVAIRREQLILDATAAMEKYSADSTIRMRRLEVRFVGESGFDAASGDEAGVTRGFYADCAEALLSAENVAGIFCSSSCLGAASAGLADLARSKGETIASDDSEKEPPKLPLWIPDLDSSNQVVIPTPRVNKRSCLGVFPRPLPHYHPQHGEVLIKFRLMGRLFAAAMRDGFMFPLPLSSSFLKMVQWCESQRDGNSSLCAERCGECLLSSEDLPRPGFLGGEVYAAETVCKALDELDTIEPPLSRVQLMRRCEEIATDKNFARKALSKTYDCSFNDYFQDRTFVDPLDPGQGEDAVPLCAKGASKNVTIYNIREWVALCKRYILHDGILAQAQAFRKGIEDFFSPKYLTLFTAEELQNDVCGIGDQVDNWDESAIRKLFKLDGGKGAAEALVAVAAIGGEGGAALSRRFGPSSPTIGHLVSALQRASPIQRRQFLSFVTSVPIVTPGSIEVVPILSPSGEFLAMNDPCCLPRANTCTRRLYLPKFDDFDSFEKVLWAVVSAENRFKGFWEWSGGG